MKKSILKLFINLFLFVSSISLYSQEFDVIPGYKPGPAPELEKLSFLIGNWNVQPFFREKETDQWTKGRQSTSKITLAMDEGFIKEESMVYFVDVPWKGLSFRGYDKFSKTFRMVYLDNIWTLLDVYEGFFEGEKLIFSNERSGTHYIVPDGSGNRALVKTITYPSQSGFTMDSYSSYDKGETWTNLFRLQYSESN
ncbi:MAG: DUF1579 family protein [Flavobacteriaceae bacterium]|nr:DUF1579 family protein [Flavobacteriaceae bacterium]